jgi:hypothetical protein
LVSAAGERGSEGDQKEGEPAHEAPFTNGIPQYARSGGVLRGFMDVVFGGLSFIIQSGL